MCATCIGGETGGARRWAIEELKPPQDKCSKPNANQGKFIPSLEFPEKKVFWANVPNANSHTFMAARLVVFEPSTVCACAQVLWQQRTPLKKYFHPPDDDAEIYMPKIWTLWCKWRVISDFWGRGTALQKGQPSSFRRLAAVHFLRDEIDIKAKKAAMQVPPPEAIHLISLLFAANCVLFPVQKRERCP